MNKLKFYDIEVYPEWWCVVVSDQEDSYLSSAYKNKFTVEEELKIKDKMRVYTSDGGRPELERLRADVQRDVLSGYNIKRYDLIALNCMMMGFTPAQMYIVNDLLINPETINDSIDHRKIANYIRTKFKAEAFQDLMDDSDKGLKDKEAAFGMDIRETTVPFGKRDLTEQEKLDIIYYCKHDVYALHVQYACISQPYIDTKLALCKTYDLPTKVGYEATNAVLSGKVLKAERRGGTTITDPTIVIYEKELNEYFKKWIPAELYTHLLTSQKAKNVQLFDNKVFTADGGLHSIINVPKVGREQGVLYVEASETHGLWNVDASSCYPATMIHCNAMSRGVTDPKRFVQLYQRRLDLKSKPKSEWTADEKNFVAAAKLVLNTTYGAMGNQYLPLYDDYMRSKVCRVGQMILIALANNIYTTTGCKIIQTNTDGILVYGPREKLPQIQSVVGEFERVSNFIFEVEEDKKIWQLNVNNYIAMGIDDKLKLKGGSFITTIFQPGYNKVRPLGMHVIAKAQIEFYTKKTNPVKFLLEHAEVSDFCVTCTKGGTYHAMVQKNRDGEIVMGKVARVIGTMNDKYGVVKKYKWQPIKPTAAQKAKGETVETMLERYKQDKKAVNFTKGEWCVWQEDTVANCPPHTWIVNDALYNYKIEGPYTNRRLVHKDGSSAQIDLQFYASKLNDALALHWFKLKDGKLLPTKEFNL